jgi:hypothetical protein
VRPAIIAEKAGIPSVTITATSFLDLVHLLGVAEGVPNQRAAEYPGTLSVESEAVIREKLTKTTLNDIIEALTKPIKDSEDEPDEENLQTEYVFSNYYTYEEINETFRRLKLTDELPIIPPTPERVEEFMKFTDYPPDKEVAILPPGNLRATPTVIAANGVMAGCQPEHMPILIAAVEALADPHFNLAQLGTTGAINPFLLINGPIIKQLGFQFGIGLISRGPNPTVGRALGLMLRNLANFRPGEQYMGTFGYILPFVVAEDEEASPWEPFHVDQGFHSNTSTVTVGGTMNWGFYGYPSGENPEGHLKIICREIVRNVDQYAPIILGHLQMMTLLMTPNVADAIARGGYSKQDVAEYLYDKSRVTIEEINFLLKYGYATGGTETIKGLIEKGASIPRDWGELGPKDTVPVLGYPGVVHIAVCGDPSRNKVLALHTAYNRPVTKKIKLPQRWDALLQESGHCDDGTCSLY